MSVKEALDNGMKEDIIYENEINNGIRNQKFFIFDKQHAAINSDIKENTAQAYLVRQIKSNINI